ncbi:MAG TPA: S-methyl-5'-thioadenosine phosphorylase [Candidatus Bathyarchaeia archaeon]|nr:S-methyl-5'-thioadenosine phosphorylase [Candidatus Bathyarchaeia archaeon]
MKPIAIIGGSGVKSIIKGEEKMVGTPYGPTPNLTIGQIKGRETIYLPRHGEGHTSPPHKVNYRANIWGLKSLGVERIIATNAVGAIDSSLTPGDIVIPSDIIDFTKSRHGTFYDGAPVTHIDVSEPYCPTIRSAIANAGSENKKNLRDDIVMACTEGPRYETPAEIRMLKTLGGGIVGMTGAPEAFLARELEICYASVSFISNMAAGLQRTLSAKEVEEKGRETSQILNKILIEAIGKIPEARTGCACGRALAQAQLDKQEVKEQTC